MCGAGRRLSRGSSRRDALASILDALSNGDSAVDKYIGGAAVGGALAIFPIGGLGVLVGLAMYLPFAITLAYGVGCVISMVLKARLGARWFGTRLVPIAAGLIVGEALTQLTAATINLISSGM